MTDGVIKIERISVTKQKRIFEEHLNERLEIQTLTHASNKNHHVNRLLAFELIKDKGWKYFVNNFIWIQDPEANDLEKKEIPFLLYDFQELAGDEILKAILDGYDLPIEKSRKMGLTWLVLAILLYGWMFKEWDILIGSRKAEEVDKRGDMGTLFEKLRFMIKRLPSWMINEMTNRKFDTAMKLIHPKHGASIVGEGNNPDFGRSDRRKISFLDEFTSWEFTDRPAWQGLSATTKCRIPVSTPNRRGTNCYFHKIIKDCKKNGKPYLSLFWTLHPEFSDGLYYSDLNLPRSPWYDYEVKRAEDPQSVAQEIDMNYSASMGDKVFSGFDYEEQVVENLKYNENLPLYVAWDFGLNKTAIVWIQPDGDSFNIIDEYQNDTKDIYHYIDIIDSKPYKAAMHYGDPFSGESKQYTSGQSPATILRGHGIVFRSQRTKIAIRVASGRNILNKIKVSDECIFMIEMFSSWQMVKPKSGNTSSETPAKDEHSHIGEAFTYFAFNYKRLGKGQKRDPKKYAKTASGVM